MSYCHFDTNLIYTDLGVNPDLFNENLANSRPAPWCSLANVPGTTLRCSLVTKRTHDWPDTICTIEQESSLLPSHIQIHRIIPIIWDVTHIRTSPKLFFRPRYHIPPTTSTKNVQIYKMFRQKLTLRAAAVPRSLYIDQPLNPFK